MTWQLIKDALLGKEQDFTRLPLKTAIFILALPMILEMMKPNPLQRIEMGAQKNKKKPRNRGF